MMGQNLNVKGKKIRLLEGIQENNNLRIRTISYGRYKDINAKGNN